MYILLLYRFLQYIHLYRLCEVLTRDPIISQYFISLLATTYAVYNTSSIVHTFSNQQLSMFIQSILAYYLFDTFMYALSNRQNKYIMMVYHLTTMRLIMLHIQNILPRIIGLHLLYLFEYSNMFLLLFQLCKEKQWITAQNILAYPLVFTYVPIRLIYIPLCIREYISPLLNLEDKYKAFYCFTLLSFVTGFSMYYALLVLYKFTRHLRRLT
jgi:hypothetical protein